MVNQTEILKVLGNRKDVTSGKKTKGIGRPKKNTKFFSSNENGEKKSDEMGGRRQKRKGPCKTARP